MKFLLDQSADFRLIPYLEDLGHDVQVISRHYPHGLLDEEVLAIARRERRVLLVADRAHYLSRLDGRGLKGSTRHRKVAAIKTFLRYLEREAYLPTDFSTRISWPEGARARRCATPRRT